MTLDEKTHVSGRRSYLTQLGLGELADDDRLAEALKDFCSQIEAGQVPDRSELLQRYADLQPALAGCFDALEFVYSVAPQAAANDPEAADAPIAALAALGDFRILRAIGRGGMGVIYEAEQLSLGRRVALKVLPFAAMLSEQRLKRFQNEARAAATLSHPNIVTVYAVGVDRGVHYYAMELIHGPSVAEVIQELQRQTSSKRAPNEIAIKPALTNGDGQGERSVVDVTEEFRSDIVSDQAAAETARHAQTADTAGSMLSGDGRGHWSAHFRAVARIGIQAAEALDHAHQNGIVHRDIKPANLLLDATGHTWVTDFGLARIESDPAVTMTGDLFGTLRYMSPEQILSKRVVLDHRTDIYSLGLTLYEMLVLQPAFKAHERDELFRAIAFEEPTPPRRLNGSIPVDLETIVLKAVQKNPADRYATAQELADDLERFLGDEPIRARRPTLAQRAAKWSRRHRTIVTSAIVTLILITVAASVAAGLVWRERQRAVAEAAQKQAILDFLVHDLLAAADPELTEGRVLSVLEVLANAESKIEGAFQDQPLVEASVRIAMGSAYQALGEYEAAGRHFARASDVHTRLLGPEDSLTLRSREQLAIALMDQGRYAEAEESLRDILEARRHIYGPQHPDSLDSMTHLANSLGYLCKYSEAESVIREVLEFQRQFLGPDHAKTLASMDLLAKALLFQNRFRETEAVLSEVLAAKHRVYGPAHPSTHDSMSLWALWLVHSSRPTEAEHVYREVLEVQHRLYGSAHPRTLQTMQNLANMLDDVGKLQECVQLRREITESRRSTLGPEHPKTLDSMIRLGVTLRQVNPTEAEQLHSRALEIWRRADGQEHPGTLEAMYELATTWNELGKFEEARNLAQQTLDAQRKVLGPEYTLPTQVTLANALEGLSRWKDARQLRADVLRLSSLDDREVTLVPFKRDLARVKSSLALNIALTEDAPPHDRRRALELAEQAIELDANDSESWRTLGIACAASRQWQKSLGAFKRALELGYRDELAPASILEQLRQSGDDEYSRKELLEFLRENATNLATTIEQNSDTE